MLACFQALGIIQPITASSVRASGAKLQLCEIRLSQVPQGIVDIRKARAWRHARNSRKNEGPDRNRLKRMS